MPKKVLITGCYGLLGQKLVAAFRPPQSDFQVIGVDKTNQTILNEPFISQTCDITNRDAVKEVILHYHPDLIINTAAMTDVDLCEIEREACWRINVEAVKHLIYASNKIGCKIIQISSDYVFDGTRAPYDENSRPKPLGFYGKSKLASENELLLSGLPFNIIRSQILFGTGINIRPNFVTWVLAKLAEKKTFSVVTDQSGNPTLADNLAEAIYWCVELEKEGLFHISGRECISRFDFARKIASVFGYSPDPIQPILTESLNQKAKRPANSQFIINRAEIELVMKYYDVNESLEILKNQIQGKNGTLAHHHSYV